MRVCIALRVVSARWLTLQRLRVAHADDSAPETNQVPFYKGPMAMNLLKQGVEKYQQKGVSPARLVLAFPWYSYAWIVNKTCSGNGTCPGALARTDIGVGQTPSAPTFTCPGGSFAPITGFYFPPSLTGTGHCPSAMGLVPYSTHGEEWDEWGSTPFIRYSDPRVPCVTECGYHYEVWCVAPRACRSPTHFLTTIETDMSSWAGTKTIDRWQQSTPMLGRLVRMEWACGQQTI